MRPTALIARVGRRSGLGAAIATRLASDGRDLALAHLPGYGDLAAWTAGFSVEAGPKGLTANTISPGYIAGTDFFHGNLTDQRRAALIEATHDGRAGKASDVAETAWFLASPGARHITGQVLHVNGGAHTTR